MKSLSETKTINSTLESTQVSLKKVKSLLFKGQEVQEIDLDTTGVPKKMKFHMVSENIEAVFDFPSTFTLSQALMMFLESFIRLPLDRELQNYEVYMSKKNGQPKYEYGAFLLEQQIGKTGCSEFSIIHVVENTPTIKNTSFSKRKNTDSPTRLPLQLNMQSSAHYNSQLECPIRDIDDLRDRKKALSKEIEYPKSILMKKKQNWILTIFGCGCTNE